MEIYIRWMKKDKLQILQRIRMRAELKRRRKKIGRFRHGVCNGNEYKINQAPKLSWKQEFIQELLPPTLKYLINNQNSPFSLKDIRKKVDPTNGIIEMPKKFSIIDEPEISYETLRKIIRALLIDDINKLTLDYRNCESTELSTQVLLDIILKEYSNFQRKCINNHRYRRDIFPTFGGININNEELKEMMWSVGTAATLGIATKDFSNVEKYPLTHRKKYTNEKKRIEQKEIDTTELVEYVRRSLHKMRKELTPQKLDDLCIVIGEILINAEEHSTTGERFSIGFFREDNNNTHFGLFRLVILNFGSTIYEKFKSKDCPNKQIVKQMVNLSNKYTKRFLFFKGEFEEESLWTLYALQEGVTSVSPESYKQRGNGSIRFIESFFNIKGNTIQDNVSKMTLLSGKTKIKFDGKYAIVEKQKDANNFKVMTFNKEGDIETKPDPECVCQTKYYFPGTMLSVKLLLNEDDIQNIKS